MPAVPVPSRSRRGCGVPRAAAGDADHGGRPARHAGSRRSASRRWPRRRPPPPPARPASRRRDRAVPRPAGAARDRPLAANRRGGRRQERGLRLVPPAGSTTRTASRRPSGSAASIATAATRRPATRARPRPAPIPRRLGDLGQPGPVVHAAESRVARVHPLRQPRRPAGRPPELRHVTATPSEVLQNAQEHDDPRRHALGRGAVQQRLGPVQAGPRSARATA